MKRDTYTQEMRVSAHVHMKRDTPLLLYASVNIWMTPLHSPSNKNIKISYSLKYKHSKKNPLGKK